MNVPEAWWGLRPPAHAHAAWGARAIHRGSTFELLPDRQSAAGDPVVLNVLAGVLNRCIPHAQKALAMNPQLSDPSHSGEQILFGRRGGLSGLRADPRGSYGHLYLGMDFHDDPKFDPKEAYGWQDGLPAVGSKLRSSQLDGGTCTIVRRYVALPGNVDEGAVAACVAVPDVVPDWLDRQSPGWPIITVFRSEVIR